MLCARILSLLRILAAAAALAFFATHRFAAASDLDFATYSFELNSHGRLFLLRKDGTGDIYVFGTMHSNDPRVLDLPETVEDALASSAVLLAETRYVPEAAPYHPNFKRYVAYLREGASLCTLPNGSSLEQIIGEELFAKALARAREMTSDGAFGSIAPADLDRTTVFCAALTLGQSPAEWKRSQRGALILDDDLLRSAIRRGLSAERLETFYEQSTHALAMPVELQMEELRAALDNYGFASAEERLEHDVAAYLRGDILAIGGAWSFSQAYLDYIWRERFIARNQRMAREILRHASAQTLFVSTGAGHLIGEEGIVNLLARQGYSVTVIEPPS